ncbi:gamma-glutamylcyclotransferase [Amylibacter sp.]|nr:gamma-glutamylcyclotransferase [Amylibacter sp.]
MEEQASIINSAKGSKGHNTEYLYNVTRCLRDLDIKDLELEKLTAKTLKITG